MARIEYKNDRTRAFEEAEGSDGRLNVSARSDGRRYYNSRDKKKTFTAVYEHVDAVAGEYSMYIQNTSKTDELVISSIGLNTDEAAKIKLWFVTGTAAGGATMTPVNTNHGSSNDAEATARQGTSGSGLSGLTTDGIVDLAFVASGGHEEFRLEDTIRLGQNDAIAVEYEAGTTGDLAGVVYMYFEQKIG